MNGKLIVPAVTAIIAGGAAAATPATFESIAENSVDLAEVVAVAGRAKRDCSCLDEFEEKACNDAKAEAAELLKQKFTTVLAVGEEPLLVKLGKYDFKKHVFPASLAGGAVRTEPFTTCAGKLKPTDPCANFEGSSLSEPEPRIVVTVKSPAWSGQLAVEDESDAQQFRSGDNDNYAIRGELVLKVDAVSLALAENAQLAAKKKMFLNAFDDALKRKSSRMGPDELAHYREERQCYAKVATKEAVVTISASVVGVRLEARATPEYLVSVPASAELRSARLRREAEEAAKAAAEKAEQERRAREAAAKAKTEAEEAARQKAKAERDAKDAADAERSKQSALAERARFEEDCTKGSAVTCVQLAGLYLDAKRAPAEPEKAKAALQTACRKAEPQGCTRLGKLMAEGTVPGSKDDSDSYSKIGRALAACSSAKAFDYGAGEHCGLLAREYKSGRFLEKNDALAEQLRQKACKLRDANSCEGLEKLQLIGR